MLLERPQKKTQKKQHPTSTRLLTRRPRKKIHLAARERPRARRASELLTNTTDPAHAATRKPGEHPQHAPHLDLSPIFPLKYKTKTKIPRASRGRDAPSGRDRITFSFWEIAWSCASRRWRRGSGLVLRVDGVGAGPHGAVRGVVGAASCRFLRGPICGPRLSL